MESVFDYPHVPYWFSIGQAIRIIKVTFLKTKKYFSSMAILVFDEKYNLIGILTLRNILKSIEPSLLTMCEDVAADNKEQTTSVNGSGIPAIKGFLARPVSEIMVPVKLFVGPDDTLAKAACMMLQNDLVLLPVMDDKKRLAGLVGIADVFEGIADGVLRE